MNIVENSMFRFVPTRRRRVSSLAVIALVGMLTLGACAPMATTPSAAAGSGAATAVVARMAGTAAPPRSLLYVGNSFMYYNNSLHGHVSLLARAAADKDRAAHRAVSITISGSGMDWHDVGSYFRPNAVGRYSFVGDNEVRFNPPGRAFDAVVLMDCSQCPVHPTLRPIFFEYTKRHSDTVRANGAEPIFFMTWAYADKPEMTQGLADAYNEAGRLNDAHVIPAGLAFARSIAVKPDLNLYVPDKRHPSLAGTYLAACVFLGSVFGVSPVGNGYTAGLDAATASHLQRVAWETVQSYHRR
jgi:hypothetical protein